MKKTFLYNCLVFLWLVSFSAFGQVMQTQPVSAILQILKSEGYIAVRKVLLVDDEYQVRALDNQGDPVDIHINSHSGEIIAMEKIDSHIPMPEIVEKIEAVGYAGIIFIAVKNNRYEVVAIGPGGKKVQLRIDAMTGKISK